MEKEMEELKKLIYGLLISCPLNMTVIKLDRDYQELIGQKIPYRKFGCSSLEEFLHSIPDILKVNGCGNHAEVIVQVSNKSAHIDKLIANQRVNTPKRQHFGSRPRQRRPRREHGTRSIPRMQPTYSVPPPISSSHIINNYSRPPRFNVSSEPRLPPPAVTSPPKELLKLVFTQPPTFTPQEVLPPEQFKKPHFSPPPRFTPHEVPPLQQFKKPYFPPSSRFTPHEDPPPEQFKKPHFSPPPRFKSERIPPPEQFQKPIFSQPPTFKSNSPPTFSGALTPSGLTMRQMSPVMKSPTEKYRFDNIPKHNTLTAKSTPMTYTTPSTSGEKTKQKHIDTYMSPAPSEICDTAEEIYISDSDEIEYDTNSQGIPEDYSNSYKFVANNEPYEVESSYADYSNVPLSVQKNLQALISKFDEGIWCGNLPNIYKNMFGKELDFMEYKYKSLITMCMELRNIFYCIRPDDGDFKLYDKEKPLPKNYDKSFKLSELIRANDIMESQPTSEPVILDVHDLINVGGLNAYPEDVLQLNDDIDRQFLPEDIKEDDFIDVCIGEIFDPSKFWILLNENCTALNNVMDEMQSFYKGCDPSFKIPHAMLQRGLFCAALYNGEYHRTIIVSEYNPTSDKIKVFYVDYGTVSTISSEGICYLHRKFGILPQQAIRARLASTYPLVENTPWPHEASNRLLQLVLHKTLVAHIYHVDWERQTLELFLVDTSTDQDIYMNDTLVKEGYAVFAYQEQQKPDINPPAIPKVKHIHLFPTFNEIEQGETPGSGEIIRLLKLGVRMDMLFPKYFIHNNCDYTEVDAIISNVDKHLEKVGERLKDMVVNVESHVINDSNENDATISTKDETEKKEKCMAQSSRYRLFNKIPDEIECNTTSSVGEDVAVSSIVQTNWTELCEEDSSDESHKERNSSSFSELPSPISISSTSPELVCAKPVTRPPPGFKAIHLTATTHEVNGDNIKSTVVTQTANVGATNQEVLLLNYLLARQQNALLNSNVLPQRHVAPQQPVVIPPVTTMINQPVNYNVLPQQHIASQQPVIIPPVTTMINQPVNYMPITQEMLLLQNRQTAINQTLAFQNQIQQSNQVNFMQPSPTELLQQFALQQKLQAEWWRNMQEQARIQNTYLNQPQNLPNSYLLQPNVVKNEAPLSRTTSTNFISQERKPRNILQEIVSQHLANGNVNLLTHFRWILHQQQLASPKESGDVLGMLSLLLSKSSAIPDTQLKDTFNEILNTLNDQQIVGLAQKINEQVSTSETNVTTTLDSSKQAANPTQGSNTYSNSTIDSLSNQVENLTDQQADKTDDHKTKTSQHPEQIRNKNDNSSEKVKKQNKKNKKNKGGQYVIQAELNKKPIHVIKIQNKAYINVNEIMQFTVKKAPIERIRKLLVMVDPSNPIVDISLNEHQEVAQELSRFQDFDMSSILHMIPVTYIPKIIEVLGSKDKGTNFEEFVEKINSDLWITS